MALTKKYTVVIGIIDQHGEITAHRGDIRHKAHADFGMTGDYGRWRYVVDNGIVFWWDKPTALQKELVQGWLEGHSYRVVRHERMIEGEPSYGAAHGAFIEHLVDTLLS